MAEDVQIQGSNERGKIRNPLGVIGLTIITLGIYWVFWYYFVNKELAQIGRAKNTDECGTSPGTSVLAVTLGALVIVPAFLSIYNTCKRQEAAARLTGTPELMEPGLLFVIWVFVSPVAQYIFQSNQNKVLQAQGGAGAGAIPPAQAAPPPPPPAPAPEQPAAGQPGQQPPQS
jgi:drug/metabolite transporter (DMT)-like permease